MQPRVCRAFRHSGIFKVSEYVAKVTVFYDALKRRSISAVHQRGDSYYAGIKNAHSSVAAFSCARVSSAAKLGSSPFAETERGCLIVSLMTTPPRATLPREQIANIVAMDGISRVSTASAKRQRYQINWRHEITAAHENSDTLLLNLYCAN